MVAASPYDGAEIGRGCPRAAPPMSTGRWRRPRLGWPNPCPHTSGPRSSTGPPSRWPSARRTLPAPSLRRRPSPSARPVSRPAGWSTFRFSAVEARSLTGEMIPIDASVPGTGKLAFTLRVPVGVVGAISPFNFPLNLVSHKVAPAIAAGCPVVLEARQPDAAVRPGAGAHAAGRVRPAARLAQRRDRVVERVGDPLVATTTWPSSPSPAPPRWAGAFGSGRRARRSTSSWATTAR